MAALPFLVIGGAVWFIAMLLVAFSQASSSTTRPAGEASGILSGFTWATDLLGQAWHRLVRSTVSRFAEGHLVPLVRWFSSLNALVLGVSQAMADVAEEVTVAVEHIAARTTPKALGRASAPALKQAQTAAAKARAAGSQASSTSTALTHYKVAQHARNAHYSHALDVTIPGQFGRIRTAEDALSRDAAKLKERTASLENGAVRTFEWIKAHPLSLATSVFAGAVAIALSRLGFGFLRCRAWRSLARKVTCGHAGLLDEILFASVTGFAALDICDFADAAQSVAQTFQPTLLALVDVENALIGCHGATAAADLSLPALHLPPRTLGLALSG